MTSSGRSSRSTIIRWQSGLLREIDAATDCSTVVVPASGGASTRPRWPLPIGATRSIIRPTRLPESVSSRSRSSGCTGVKESNSTRSRAASGSAPLTLSMRTIGLNFSLRSPSRGWRTWPTIASPRRRPNFRTIDKER